MSYKIVYVEDESPDSIMSDLKKYGFDPRPGNLDTFEGLVGQIQDHKPDAVLFDYRLTNAAKFDAPAVAQMLRTKSVEEKRYTPLFLVSTEDNISSLYQEDYTSNDLFDFSVSKENINQEPEKFIGRFTDAINAYRTIVDKQFSIPDILNIGKDLYDLLDYRLLEWMRDPLLKTNVQKLSQFVLYSIVKPIGVMFGKDVLAARLGVDISSPGFPALMEAFAAAKYSGIYSISYQRWWATQVETIWENEMGLPSLRSLSASERVQHLSNIGLKDLRPAEPIEFAKNTSYWTICRHFDRPLDTFDGLELMQKRPLPWQEKEYISVLAGLESSPRLQHVRPLDRKKLSDLAEGLKKKR